MYVRKLTAVFLGCLLLHTAQSQKDLHISDLKDIIYWSDTSSGFVNNRIIDIKEGKDKSLYLLVKADNAAYDNFIPRVARITQDGKLLQYRTLTAGGQLNKSFALHNLLSLQQVSDQKWIVAGTYKTSDRIGLYEEELDNDCQPQPFAFSVAFRDLFNGGYAKDDDGIYNVRTLAATANGKEVYNMWLQASAPSLFRNTRWQTKIASEANEENVALKKDRQGAFYLLGYRYIGDGFNYRSPLLYKTDSTGKVLWSRLLEEELNPRTVNLEVDRKGAAYVTVSYGEEREMSCRTTIYAIDSKGGITATSTLDKMRANGVLALRSGNLLLYGSNLKSSGNMTMKSGIITKAKTVLLSGQLQPVSEDEMCEWDDPDFVLPGMTYTMPTASDFLSAIELSNGRIACAGRVYMPIDTKTARGVQESERYNRSLLVFADPSGGFGSQLEKR